MTNRAMLKNADYANAMFRFEHLHKKWIHECADYLVQIFGRRLRGATVVDYAFGRGNWAAAFRRAGAARVIAIDASADNVRRFGDYCAESRMSGVEIVKGNIVEKPMHFSADIVWAHGILHHVGKVELFTSRLSAFARNRDSLFHIYAYDAGSLRQFVVQTARRAVRVKSEADFRRISLEFSPPARLRARDDLTAPHIDWFEGPALARMLRRQGLYVIRQHIDFASFQSGRGSLSEFSPHHFLCSGDAAAAIKISVPPNPFAYDISCLAGMAEAVFRSVGRNRALLRSFGVGLINAHFCAADRKDARAAVIQDYLYLLYCLAALGVRGNALKQPARGIVNLGFRALEGKSRAKSGHRTRSILEAHLLNNTIRI